MMKDPHTPWDEMDWPTLLDAARAGVGDAWGEMLGRLHGYCLLVAGNQLSPDLRPKIGASDIVQKSLLEAFARFRSFQGQSETDVRAWLATIISHNAIDAARHFRDAQRRSHRREQPLDDAASFRLAARDPSPSLAMRRSEEDAALRRAITSLSPAQQAVLEFRYRDRLDYGAIAAALDVSEVAARKTYSRAIDALRNLLAADGSRISISNSTR